MLVKGKLWICTGQWSLTEQWALSSLVRAKESNLVRAKESSLVRAKESSLVWAKESSLVRAKESSLVRAKESSLVRAKESPGDQKFLSDCFTGKTILKEESVFLYNLNCLVAYEGEDRNKREKNK